MKLSCLYAGAVLALAAPAFAQSTSGALVVVPATGEVVRPNDQAIATFGIEEQDADKAVAASRVNQKMKEGMALLHAADPQAVLKTNGYSTYPVYPVPAAQAPGAKPTGWRVAQYVQVKTMNLAGLPKTAAAAQGVLSLNSISFSLSPASLKQADAARIAATYASLNDRIGAIAAAMGRARTDAVLDTVDFEGSGNYVANYANPAPQMVAVTGRRAMNNEVAEPSFEPGETTLQMKVVGKVRFK